MGMMSVIALTASCGLVILAKASGLGSALCHVSPCSGEKWGRSFKARRYVLMAARMWLVWMY